MSDTLQERYGRHLREAEPMVNGLWAIGCMDDNFPDPGDRVLGEALYHQTPGAIDGLGTDLSVARGMSRPGDIANRTTPVHKVGKLAANRLHQFYYLGTNHDPCAAWTQAEPISSTVARESSDVLSRATEILPDVTQNKYEGVVRATGEIARSGLIAPHNISSAHYARHSRTSAKVPVAKLADTRHIAGAFAVIDTPDRMFDVKAAREAGDPAYAISLDAMAEVLHDLKQADRDTFSGILEANFLAAIAVRTSAIGTAHLLGPDKQPLPVVHI